MWRALLLATALASAMPAAAETIPGARIIVIDGDTIALPCARPRPDCAERIRLIEIDAPESFRPSCEAERRAGLRAKTRLAELLRQGDVIIHRSGKTDWCGRTLANVEAKSGDVGRTLLREGLALPYRPHEKARRTRVWCGP